MKERSRTISWLALAFVFLLLISVYRQSNLDQADYHPSLVYLGYVLLLSCWGVSVERRVVQRTLRFYIFTEIGIMLLWMTVRFLQEGYFYRYLYLMRLTGYLICIPVVLLPLLSLYGALALDQGEDYRTDGRYYILLVPAVLFMGLMLTNEYHHLVFRTLAGEPEINLYFHPNYGIWVIGLWAVALEVTSLAVVIRKSGALYHRGSLLPFILVLAMLLMLVPYIRDSFLVDWELIDLNAKMFFYRALIWESCFLLGLVPVNSQYRQVFHRATESMQITDHRGRSIIASSSAPEISREQFRDLCENGRIPTGDGAELWLYRMPEACLIWRKDLTHINAMLDQLRWTGQELEEKSELLREEIQARSTESRVRIQNEIYDRLSREVSGQILLLQRLLEGGTRGRDWEKICLVGTYIKRYCNLRLSLQESGCISAEDLRLSLSDMLSWLPRLGVEEHLDFDSLRCHSPQFFLYVVRAVETILEQTEFCLSELRINVNEDCQFQLDGTDCLPELPTCPGIETSCVRAERGCSVTVREVGEPDAL